MIQPNFITAIIRNEQDDILMILAQGENDPHPYWTLPGGRVEKGETARQALVREVQEETGLTIIAIGQLAYQTEMQFDDVKTFAEVYEVASWNGDLSINDPEDEILDVAWLPLPQAIQHLEKIADYPPMSEPPIAYLRQAKPAGYRWQYRVAGEGAVWVNNGE